MSATWDTKHKRIEGEVESTQLNSRLKRFANRPSTQREDEIAEFLKKQCDHLSEPQFEVPVRNLAYAFAAVQKMQEFLDAESMIGADGELRLSLKYYFMGISCVNKLCTSLGITPLAQARISTLRADGARQTYDVNRIR